MKNYRRVIDGMLDLADQADPNDLLRMLEVCAGGFRELIAQEQRRKEEVQRLDAVGPWFDPQHPLNVRSAH